MKYTEFRDLIREGLEKSSDGFTWKELKRNRNLPYTTPCPTWIKNLEKEIGLRRKRKRGRELIWEIPS
jgi:transposase